MNPILLFLLVPLALHLCLAEKLPSDYQTCHDFLNINDCLKGAINEVIPKLKDGLANLNVPSLDPLYVPSMVIGEGTGTVHVVQDFKKINFHGISKSVVTTLDASNLKNLTLACETVTPLLQLKADYSLQGRILLLPIQGEGNCTITLEEVVVTHESHGERFTKKGIDYMRVKEYIVTVRPKRVRFNFDNLFGGDKQLGDNINLVLNENWREVFDDVRPSYEKSLGIIFGDYANRLYTRVPLKELFGF